MVPSQKETIEIANSSRVRAQYAKYAIYTKINIGLVLAYFTVPAVGARGATVITKIAWKLRQFSTAIWWLNFNGIKLFGAEYIKFKDSRK